MPTAVEQLDLATGVGQRQATYRFDLVDGASGRPLGELHPVRAPTLSHDTTRTISRTLTGIVLDAVDTALADALETRIRPVMLIGGGEYPLGTYVFTDSLRSVTTAGRRGTLAAADLMFVVAQPVEHTTSFAAGINVGTAIASLLADVAGLEGYVVEPTATMIGSPVVWPAGTDRGRILADLATLGGYHGAYMGNDSQIRVRQSFDPAGVPATFTFTAGGNVLTNTVVETDDIIDAPNRFIVVDNSTTDTPVVGVYDVPVTAPHSAANRGFVVAQTSDIQGPGVTTTATQAAETIGRAQTLLQRVTLSTPPDPRHDAYDICAYDGYNWTETAWSLTLLEGAEMTHNLQRVYQTGEVLYA